LPEAKYEYSGLMANFWDFFRGDTSNWEDRYFFLEVILRSGQPVLDVGCGTGRLILDYLLQGLDVEGVDNSPEMLALCRQKAAGLGLSPTLYEQEMQALSLPRRYRTIIVPSSSFQLLIHLEDAAAAMSRFYQHLLPGGTLAMPFMLIGFDQNGKPIPEEEFTRQKVRPSDKAVVHHWSRSTYDHAAQLEHTQDRYQIILDGHVIQSESHSRSPATRWYTQEQAQNLYRQAGFTDIELFDQFKFERATPHSSVFCILAKRP
jgi:ubiquinone/menaquinone biosynthesis C-methylase UbiE